MKSLMKELEIEKQKTESILRWLEMKLTNLSEPEEIPIVKCRGNSFQFYTKESGGKKYLSIKEKEFVANQVKYKN